MALTEAQQRFQLEHESNVTFITPRDEKVIDAMRENAQAAHEYAWTRFGGKKGQKFTPGALFEVLRTEATLGVLTDVGVDERVQNIINRPEGNLTRPAPAVREDLIFYLSDRGEEFKNLSNDLNRTKQSYMKDGRPKVEIDAMDAQVTEYSRRVTALYLHRGRYHRLGTNSPPQAR